MAAAGENPNSGFHQVLDAVYRITDIRELYLDKGASSQYEAVVWETLNKGRGGRKIVFKVDGKPSAEFSRPRGRYPRGLLVQLIVYPGYYGISWVDEWQVVQGD